jgi:hypothetical protein
MNLISKYFSEDQMITSWVFKDDIQYVVEVLNSINHTDKKFYFDNLQEAENFAEDAIL